MAGIFTKRIWQPFVCQPNDLKVKKKTGGGGKRGDKQKSGGMPQPAPPLESPLLTAPPQKAINSKLFLEFVIMTE